MRTFVRVEVCAEFGSAKIPPACRAATEPTATDTRAFRSQNTNARICDATRFVNSFPRSAPEFHSGIQASHTRSKQETESREKRWKQVWRTGTRTRGAVQQQKKLSSNHLCAHRATDRKKWKSVLPTVEQIHAVGIKRKPNSKREKSVVSGVAFGACSCFNVSTFCCCCCCFSLRREGVRAHRRLSLCLVTDVCGSQNEKGEHESRKHFLNETNARQRRVGFVPSSAAKRNDACLFSSRRVRTRGCCAPCCCSSALCPLPSRGKRQLDACVCACARVHACVHARARSVC